MFDRTFAAAGRRLRFLFLGAGARRSPSHLRPFWICAKARRPEVGTNGRRCCNFGGLLLSESRRAAGIVRSKRAKGTSHEPHEGTSVERCMCRQKKLRPTGDRIHSRRMPEGDYDYNIHSSAGIGEDVSLGRERTRSRVESARNILMIRILFRFGQERGTCCNCTFLAWLVRDIAGWIPDGFEAWQDRR